jgi:hypothetical protein
LKNAPEKICFPGRGRKITMRQGTHGHRMRNANQEPWTATNKLARVAPTKVTIPADQIVISRND